MFVHIGKRLKRFQLGSRWLILLLGGLLILQTPQNAQAQARSTMDLKGTLNNQTTDTANKDEDTANQQKTPAKRRKALKNKKRKVQVQAKEPQKDFSVGASVGRMNSLYNLQDGNQVASWNYSLFGGYNFGNNVSLSALVGASTDITSDESDFSVAMLTLRKDKIDILDRRIYLAPFVSSRAPVSKADRYASFAGNLSLGLRASANPDYLISKRLGLASTVNVTRNFHDYETAVSGKVNTQYSSLQGFDASWAFNDVFSISLNVSHYDTFSYFDTHQDYISHSQELGIQFNRNFSAAVGHQFGLPFVPTRKADGQTLNLDLTNEQNSIVYGQLTVTY